MILRINYCIAQVHYTARYIWDNNPHVKNWPTRITSPNDLVVYIKSLIVKHSRENAESLLYGTDSWSSYTGTGGFIIHFSSDYNSGDTDIDIDVDVMVDPSVGLEEKGFTHIEISLD